MLALKNNKSVQLYRSATAEVNHYHWHCSWKAPPTTSLCSHPRVGLHKCSATSETVSGCHFWHMCNGILVARFNFYCYTTKIWHCGPKEYNCSTKLDTEVRQPVLLAKYQCSTALAFIPVWGLTSTVFSTAPSARAKIMCTNKALTHTVPLSLGNALHPCWVTWRWVFQQKTLHQMEDKTVTHSQGSEFRSM